MGGVVEGGKREMLWWGVWEEACLGLKGLAPAYQG